MATIRTPVEKAIGFGAYGACAAGLVFLILPIGIIVPLSFNADAFFSYPIRDVSLRWYETLAASPAWQRALANSLLVGLASTAIATLLGAVAALGLSRLGARIRPLMVALLVSPMIVPGVVTALGLFLFFSSVGLAGSLPGLVVAHTILGVPFVVITVSAALVAFDGNLLRAAASLGASPITAFRRILVPLIMPALASSALLVFVTSFDEFIVTSFLAGPEQFTLPLQMWSGVHDDVKPTILAAATLFVLVSGLALILIETLRRRADRLTGVRLRQKNREASTTMLRA